MAVATLYLLQMTGHGKVVQSVYAINLLELTSLSELLGYHREEVARDLKGAWGRKNNAPTDTHVQIVIFSCGLSVFLQKQFSEDQSPVEPYLGGSD